MPLNPFEERLLEQEKSNPYRETVEQQAQPVLDEWLVQRKTQRETALRRSSQQARPVVPDRQADILRLSERTGLAPGLVDRNFDEVHRRVEIADTPFLKILRESPTLGEWIADPANMALVQDDLPQLGKIDWLLTQGRDYLGSLAAGPVGFTGTALSGLGELNRVFGDALARLLPQSVEDALRKPALPWWGDPSEILRRPGSAASQGAESLRAPAERRGISHEIVEAIGQMGGQIGVAALTGGSGSMVSLFAQGAGIQAEQIAREPQSQEPNARARADAAILLGAVVTAATERFGLDVLMRRVPEAVKNRAISALSGVWIGAASEATQEVSEAVAQDVARRFLTYPEAKIGEGSIYEGIVAGSAGGIVEAGLLALAIPGRRARMRQQAEQNEAFFTALGEGVANSKTLERMPAKLAELVGRLTKDGPLEKVYVDAEAATTYLQEQNIDPAEYFERLTGSREEYAQALATAEPLAISIAAYATQVAPSEHNAFFAKELKTEPGQLSAREMTEMEAAFEKADTERLAAEAKEDEATKQERVRTLDASTDRVRQDVIGQFVNLGFDSTAVQGYAEQMASVFRSWGSRLNQDPFAIYEPYRLRITRPVPEILRTLPPATELDVMLDRIRRGDQPEGREMFGPSLVDFLRAQGGVIDEGGELRSLEVDADRPRGQRNLIQEKGLPLDRAREAAAEAGYVPRGTTVADFLDAIEREVRGAPVYTPFQADMAKVEQAQQLEQLSGYLKQRDIDMQSMTNAEIKTLLNQSAVAEVDARTGELLEQPAYHGSPHAFDKFSLQKIGTGEGAQAYGWGLYFAGAKDVAEYYRKKLSKQPTSSVLAKIVMLDGNPLNAWPSFNADIVNADKASPESLAVAALVTKSLVHAGTDRLGMHAAMDLLDRRRAVAVNEVTSSREKYPQETEMISRFETQALNYKAAMEWLDVHQERLTVKNKMGGRLYKVEIPADSKYLDWDKPLSQQDEKVQAALERYRLEALARTSENTDFVVSDVSTDKLRDYVADEIAKDNIDETDGDLSGEELYRILIERFDDSAEEASRHLASLGIPGIKYLDQSSRSGLGKYDVTWYTSVDRDRAQVIDRTTGKQVATFDTFAEADAWVKAQPDKEAGRTYNYVIFDDRLINIVEYEQRTKDPRARFRITVHGFIIELLAKANLSSFLHESAHLYLEVFGSLVADLQAAPPETLQDTERQFLADYQTALEFMGVESVEQWRAMSGEERKPFHENFARAYEAYLREGKAPSPRLRAIFGRFRAWLLRLYRSMRDLNIELSPEIRGVFDRMLATDAEIAQVQQDAGVSAMLEDAALREKLGMTEAESAAYLKATEEERTAIRERVETDLLKDVWRENEQWWSVEKAKVQAEVEQEIHRYPVYQALSVLQKGTLPDGSPLPEGMTAAKLDRAALLDMPIAQLAGEGFLKRLPRPYIYTRQEGGQHPDMVAPLFGYSSGDAMIRSILEARPMKPLIEAETDQRMRERHGDKYLNGAVPDMVKAAAMSEGRARIVALELAQIRKKQKETAPFVRVAKQQGQAAVETERREREYERRWLEAEADLRIAIAEGRKQAEIDALEGDLKRIEAETRVGRERLRSVPSLDQVRQWATARVQGLRVRELNSNTYWIAARKAATAASDAAAANDFNRAFDEKLKHLMNTEMFRAVSEAKQAVVDAEELAKHLQKKSVRQTIGKAGEDWLDQIDGLLDRFDFARISQKAIDRRVDLRTWIAEQQAQDVPVEIPPELANEARRVNYKELTVEELQGLTDSLKHLAHLARHRNKLLRQARKQEMDEVRADVIGSLVAHAGKSGPIEIETRLPQDQQARKAHGLFAMHRKMSSLVRQMDGFEMGGVLWDYVVRPANESADRQTVMNNEATRRLAEIFDAYKGREQAALYRKVYQSAIGREFTKMGTLMLALNWGNLDGRQRITSHYGWTEAQVMDVLNTLDAKDWTFVTDVWGMVNSYWSEIAAKEKRVTGLAPEKVEAAPFTTRFGEMPGGYFPLSYDNRQAASVGLKEDASFADMAKHAAYGRSTTKRGHTQKRLDNVNLPVRFDFGVIFEHVDQVIHDLTHHEMLIDAGRILGDRKIQQTIYETHGEIYFTELKAAFRDIAIGHLPSPSNAFESIVERLRSGATIAGLGLNVSTALLQPFGLTQGMVLVGPGWVAKGMTRFARDAVSMESTARWIADRSTFMRHRRDTFQRDINEIRNKVGLTTGKLGGWVDEALGKVTGDRLTRHDIADSYFSLIQKAQAVADIPIWIGMYEKAMADNANDEARAIALADQAVRDSQGSGQIQDLARVERGVPMMRLWTNFYSFFNATYNLQAEAIGRARLRGVGPRTIGRLALDTLMLTVIPATLSAALREALTPGDEEDDDYAALAKRLIWQNVAYVLGMMAGARELSGWAEGYKWAGPAGFRIMDVFANRLGPQVVQIGRAFLDDGVEGAAEEFDPAFWRTLNDAGGVLFHYPSTQVRRTVEGVMALMEGTTQNPFAVVMGAPRE